MQIRAVIGETEGEFCEKGDIVPVLCTKTIRVRYRGIGDSAKSRLW